MFRLAETARPENGRPPRTFPKPVTSSFDAAAHHDRRNVSLLKDNAFLPLVGTTWYGR
ncbi:hypothetical protein BN903_11 [Halorubrum sp. AJ67]|nr:hypothetical protein BN903_11 [Halorubrum sp. AJ67]